MAAVRPARVRRSCAGAAVLVTSLGTFGALAVLAPAPAFADLPANCTGTGTITCTFDYTGTDQTWTVPAGVTSAYIDVLGAAGAGEPGAGFGGLGGETTGTVTLTPGSTVHVLVGQAGGLHRRGFNGGGFGLDGGGGASDVRLGGAGLGDRVLIAGGGGGSSAGCLSADCSAGGSGGGAVGGDGTSPPVSGFGGAGGTQTTGGTGAGGATSGRSGQGGDGAGEGGGGGGGYFGGAGGGSDGTTSGAGGGGSGFFLPDTTRVTGGSTFNGMREGDGLVRFVYTEAPADRSPQTITFPALPDRSIVESPFTFSGVSGGDSGNPVTFSAAGQCTVSGAQVTLTHTGTCTITAHQAGNAEYSPAPDVARTFTITAKPSLRAGDTSTAEGNTGTHGTAFHVTLSRPVSVPVTVQWHTANGTAKAGSDYVASSGTVTFSPGQTDRVVTVSVKGDRTREANEVFSVVLTNPHNATIADGTGQGTVVNDD